MTNLSEVMMQVLSGAKAKVSALGGDLVQAPAEFHDLYTSGSAALMSGGGVRGFTYLLILLIVGAGIEWLYWINAYASWRAAQAAPAATPGQALRAGLRQLVLSGAGLLLFALATIGASAAFAWPAGVQEVLIAATLLILVLRLAWILIATALAPGHPRLRLVPIRPRHARWLAAALMGAVCLLALGRFVPDLLERIAGAQHVAGAMRLGAYGASALILAATSLIFFGRGGGATRGAWRGLPRFPREFVLAAMVFAVFGVWLINGMAAGIAAILAVVVALQIGLRDIVFFFWDGNDDPSPIPSIVLSASRFVVTLLGLGACLLVLDRPLADMATPESPFAHILLRALGVATLALLTHVVWIAVRSSVDHRMKCINEAATPEERSASARLLTLLPLLRMVTAILLLVMLVLSSLWTLGIEITPLLAGAGVVGIALGFGAQALVRDVIAGIFFLAEDAFRVGEYIEGAGTSKGTVEKITLRTVALRHHNGPLYFVPYGNLGTVRNNSRDWVVEKFNIPLPIDVDSEKIRKMIKKIGEEMKADPAIGPLMLEPLKGKLYRIDPGVKIFRCKFQTPPGKQFDVRANALKRIEMALRVTDIGFADGTQTVLLQSQPKT
jgi:small-conductance mechanosensitive channel